MTAAGPLEDKLGWLEDTLGWLEDKLYFQLAKRRYDEQLAKRPRRIILVRHGQSQGNVDDKVYATVPDSQIALTERGNPIPKPKPKPKPNPNPNPDPNPNPNP